MGQFERHKLKDYVLDYDLEKGLVYVKEWGDDDNGGKTSTYSYSFTYEDGTISVDMDSKMEVIGQADDKSIDEKIEKQISRLESIVKKFLPTDREIDVIKQFNEETHTVVEPLYIAYGEVDAHGDTYKNKEAVYQLVDAINEKGNDLQKAIGHVHKTDCFDIIKAYVIDKPTMLGDKKIDSIQPVIEVKYKSKAFELRKQGKLKGLSIGCSAWDIEIVKSVLDEFKVKSKPKRLLANFDFSKKRHHLSLTTEAGGGAASLKEWFVELEKSMLPKTDMALLEELGEEFTELEKQKLSSLVSNENTPSIPSEIGTSCGVDNLIKNEGKLSEMSEKTENEIALEKQIEKLEEKLKTSEIEKSLSKYSFAEDLYKSLSSIYMKLESEDYEVLTKTIDKIVSENQEKVSELEKQLEKVDVQDNELAKQLSQEQGSSEVEKPKANLTLAQKVSAANKQTQE